MKKLFFILLAIVALSACTSIPDTSVFEKLPSDKLAKALKQNPDFEEIYSKVSRNTDNFNEIEKAKFLGVTWRSLYNYEQFRNDTTKLKPLKEQWENEWKERYAIYETKVDSVITYWENYKSSNSLSKFVKVDFAVIDKDYYPFMYDVKDVNLGFRLTPINCIVEQIRFSYRYSAKIDSRWGDKHYCRSTTPFNSSVVRYWQVGYEDEKIFKDLSTLSFIRDYDIDIEVTNVRVDGVNYSIDDLHIPSEVTSYSGNSVEYMNDYYREKLIQGQICASYKRQYKYIIDKLDELLENKFPSEHLFMKKLNYKG